MTLVVCWKTEEGIFCVADSKISQESAAGTSTITDAGAKVFIIPVSTKCYEANDLVVTHNHTLGFAFCGSTLLANNTHAIATNCTQIIRNNLDLQPVSVELIANIYSKVAEYVIRDYNQHQISRGKFEGYIFGYCQIAKKFRLFYIVPETTNTTFRVHSIEYDLGESGVSAIGSGIKEFQTQIQTPNSAGLNRPVLDVALQVMQEGKVESVGGNPQLLLARETGVVYYPIVTQNPDNLDQAITTINGFNTDKIDLPKGIMIGTEFYGIGTEKLAARKALQEFGIDPDTPNISRDLQNLASFQYLLKISIKEGLSCTVDDNFTIEKITPVAGQWYYYARCKNCRRKTPLIEDPTQGCSDKKFTGCGSLISKCNFCGHKVKALAKFLKSFEWKK